MNILELFGIPLLARIFGLFPAGMLIGSILLHREMPETFGEWKKADKRREFLRASLTAEGSVALYRHQGAGVMASLVEATGLIDNPPGQVIQAGDTVRFLSFSELLG